jgi:hypothetical protein
MKSQGVSSPQKPSSDRKRSMLELESSLIMTGSVLAGGLDLFLSMREIILAFLLFLAVVFAPASVVMDLGSLVTAIGEFTDGSGLRFR